MGNFKIYHNNPEELSEYITEKDFYAFYGKIKTLLQNNKSEILQSEILDTVFLDMHPLLTHNPEKVWLYALAPNPDEEWSRAFYAKIRTLLKNNESEQLNTFLADSHKLISNNHIKNGILDLVKFAIESPEITPAISGYYCINIDDITSDNDGVCLAGYVLQSEFMALEELLASTMTE